jgi:hypothetical protein
MQRYQQRVPDVARIVTAMQSEGLISGIHDLENDHIAFRTLGVPNLGIVSLEKIFLYYGYEKKDYYYFAEKKLNAYWYAPPQDYLPRIFLSELRVDDLSETSQSIIKSYTDEVKSDPVYALDLENAKEVDAFLHSGLWRLPTWKDFAALSKESEYAAWAIYNRYYLNHFTISVHNLKEGYNSIELFNSFLKRHGFKLNNAGGSIKHSSDGALLQSSTVAQLIEAVFAGGDTHLIAGSYVEFAERKLLSSFQHMLPDQIQRHHRREGFEAGNADKIFESTYSSQIHQ